ncbi:MAG: hypothetical protein ACOH1J_04925 [Microbacteriaceae bacterium]
MTTHLVAHETLPTGTIVLHFSGYSLLGAHDPAAFTALIARAHSHGVVVWIDPGSAGYICDFGVEAFLDAIATADILLPNLEEGHVLTGLTDHLVSSLPSPSASRQLR